MYKVGGLSALDGCIYLQRGALGSWSLSDQCLVLSHSRVAHGLNSSMDWIGLGRNFEERVWIGLDWV